MNQSDQLTQLNKDGYSFLSNIYSNYEVAQIRYLILNKKLEGQSFHKTKDLFAIRELLNVIPELTDLILNDKLISLISELKTGNKLFISKAIYFDKPKDSNWFVPFHQDLTINVSEKTDIEGFKNWTNKRGLIGVQPPIEYLNRTITIRIHLDDTDETNGALRVVPKSHSGGVIRLKVENKLKQEVSCITRSGGLMLMKPLVLHASNRSTGKRSRRVIHLELCDMELPEKLNWKERQEIPKLSAYVY